MIGWMRRHPVVTAVLLLCTLAGAVAAIFIAPDEWHPARSSAAGALTGLWIGMITVGWRGLAAANDEQS